MVMTIRKKVYFLSILFFCALLQYLPLDQYVIEMKGLKKIDDSGTTITNYFIVVVLIVFILLFKKISVNRKAFFISISIYLIYLLNYLLAPYRNSVWLFYQTIFLFTAYYIASIYSTITKKDFNIFTNNVILIMTTSLFFLSILSTWLLIYNNESLLSGYFDGYIAVFNDYFYWQKQSINAFSAIIICYVLTSEKHRILNATLLLPISFIIVGMRSLLLGFSLTFLFLTIKNMKVISSFIMLILVFIVAFFDKFIELMSFDIRIMSYANMIDILRRYPFGVGNGVYHTFVRQYQNIDFSYLANYDVIPVAPESDVVYVFGSFGLLIGCLFYGILIWVLIKSKEYYPHFGQTDKYFVLIYIYFVFAGIGEDWIFSFAHWILFGFALGALTSDRAVIVQDVATSLSLPSACTG